MAEHVFACSCLTAPEATVSGQLKGSLRTVPALPGKLILALLNPTLRPCSHAAGVDEVGLEGREEEEEEESQGDHKSPLLSVATEFC